MTIILHKCSIYPLAFDTSTSNIKELLYSTKAIFPDSILDAIILHFKDTPLPEPLTFKITSQLGMSAHSMNGTDRSVVGTIFANRFEKLFQLEPRA